MSLAADRLQDGSFGMKMDSREAGANVRLPRHFGGEVAVEAKHTASVKKKPRICV